MIVRYLSNTTLRQCLKQWNRKRLEARREERSDGGSPEVRGASSGGRRGDEGEGRRGRKIVRSNLLLTVSRVTVWEWT